MENKVNNLEFVRELINDRFGVEIDEIDRDMTFSDLGADSLDLVELIMEIEDKYNLQFDDRTIVELNTVGDIVDYLEKNQVK